MAIFPKRSAPSRLLKQLFKMKIYTALILLWIIAIVNWTVLFKEHTDPPDAADTLHAANNTSVQDIPFVLVVCKGGKLPPSLAYTTPDEILLRQVAVLLKSAAALTSERIRFVLLCDDYSTYESIVKDVNKWPSEYQNLITLQYQPIYKPSIGNVLKIYAPCATESLFLPWALPELTAAIYMDTDTFFLRPPQDLINIFKSINDKQVLGAAPVDGYYLQHNIQIPYHGATGMSSGLLLANLTRWRQLPFSWLTSVEAVLKDYGDRITTGDQCIFNIIFSEYPDYIYIIGCEWNGSIEQCKSTNWACDGIEARGFSLVHGARWRFFTRATPGKLDFMTPMRVMFDAWERHRLGAPVSGLLDGIMQELTHLEEDGIKKSTHLSHTKNETFYFCRYDFRKLFVPLAQFVARTEPVPV